MRGVKKLGIYLDAGEMVLNVLTRSLSGRRGCCDGTANLGNGHCTHASPKHEIWEISWEIVVPSNIAYSNRRNYHYHRVKYLHTTNYHY